MQGLNRLSLKPMVSQNQSFAVRFLSQKETKPPHRKPVDLFDQLRSKPPKPIPIMTAEEAKEIAWDSRPRGFGTQFY